MILTPDTVEVARPRGKCERRGAWPVVEEGLDLDWSAFYGAEVSINQRVQFAVNVHSCLAHALVGGVNHASSLAQAALYLAITQLSIEQSFSNSWKARQPLHFKQPEKIYFQISLVASETLRRHSRAHS